MVSGREILFSGVATSEASTPLQATLVILIGSQNETNERQELEEGLAGKRWDSVGGTEDGNGVNLIKIHCTQVWGHTETCYYV